MWHRAEGGFGWKEKLLAQEDRLQIAQVPNGFEEEQSRWGC
jgi:hypothetical protein